MEAEISVKIIAPAGQPKCSWYEVGISLNVLLVLSANPFSHLSSYYGFHGAFFLLGACSPACS